MLAFFATIAVKLAYFQRLFIFITIFCLCSFIGVLLLGNQATNDQYLFALALSMVWSLLVLLLIYSFSHLPQAPLAKANWVKRIVYRMKIGFLHVLAVACSLLFLAAVFTSFRLISYGFYS